MPNKMLIDASHPEETRVVVVRGNRIEEFDFESQDKKQLKGNIYLARVTRVEPSLQAAFVEYGGNRHGFLAFSEIHPDYYQIPVADRQALLRAEAQEAEDDDEEAENGEEQQARDRGGRRNRRRGGKNRDRGEHRHASSENEESPAEPAALEQPAAEPAGSEEAGGATADASPEDASIVAEAVEVETDQETAEEPAAEIGGDQAADDEDGKPSEGGATSIAASVEADVISEAVPQADQPEQSGEAASDNDRGMLEDVSASHSDEHEVESVGAEDALEEIRNRRKPVQIGRAHV